MSFQSLPTPNRSPKQRSALANGSRPFLVTVPGNTEAARHYKSILDAVEAERGGRGPCRSLSARQPAPKPARGGTGQAACGHRRRPERRLGGLGNRRPDGPPGPQDGPSEGCARIDVGRTQRGQEGLSDASADQHARRWPILRCSAPCSLGRLAAWRVVLIASQARR